MKFSSFRQALSKTLAIATFALTAASASSFAQTGGAYKVTNLISDGSVPAAVTDSGFINPWAISTSGTWWISTAGSGFNYVVPATTGAISFKVVVPAASGATTAIGQPTGSVTTGGALGMILPNQTKASFIFSTYDGTIAGWNSKLGTAGAICTTLINNSSAGAIYNGLAILNNATASYILAPNFGTGNAVEVYDSTFKKTALAGTFTDPTLPANYAPYAVHIIGTQIFVTYALRTTTTPYRTVNAAGNGIVSIFDATGTFVSHAVTGGNLNAPWGVAIAPANFGIYSKDLLIGNFGDGFINVYDPKSFAFLGQLIDGTGAPLVYPSLWELLPGGTPVSGGASVSGGDTSTVYFTAGLTNESHGLFAAIANSTATGTPAIGLSASNSTATVTAGNSTQIALSVSPTYNFSGTVSLACSGLPATAVCSFSPSTFTVSGIAPTTGTVTIQTFKSVGSLHPRHRPGTYAAAIASALLLPFASFLGFRRRAFQGRRSLLAILPLALLMLVSSNLLTGCSSSVGSTPTPSTPNTPAGTSSVVVTATSGAVTQKTTINLTVQ